MAFKLASLVVDISANADPLWRALGSVKSGLGSAMSGMGSLVSKGAGIVFAPLVGAANIASSAMKGAFLAVGLAAVVGLGYAINQASDLNETVSKVETVFGSAAKVVKDSADRMADSLGIPKREFMDAAAGIGLMGKAAGLTKRQAADMGVAMAKLGADAASFYNIPLDQALEKIRAGLAGEAEPLRTMGVMLTEAAVQTEAYSMKLAKEGAELTEGQKIKARVALITKGLSDANGDLMRTQDGVANRLREVQGRFQNLAADIGQFFIPAVKRVAGGFTEAISAAQSFVADNKAMFDEWGANLERGVGVGIVAFKNWRDSLEIARLWVGEKIANIKETFSWLLDNIPPVMDRIALAFENGMKMAMQGMANVAKVGMVRLIDIIRSAPTANLAEITMKFLRLDEAIAIGMPQSKPRDFTTLNLSKSKELEDALGAMGKKAEEAEALRSAKSLDEIVAEGKAAGDKAEAERKAREKEQSTLAGRRGLRQDTPQADAARKRAQEEALKNNPPEVAAAEVAAAAKRKDSKAGITDVDSFAREMQEGALRTNELAIQQIKVAESMDKKLETIAQNTMPGVNRGQMKPITSAWN